jgi:Protein of unknown function (DUF3237)
MCGGFASDQPREPILIGFPFRHAPGTDCLTGVLFHRIIGPGGGVIAIELVPLYTLRLQLKPPIEVGAGPTGTRLIVEVASAQVKGDRLRGEMLGAAAADWVIFGPGSAGTVDVRATHQTDDGAIIFVQ